SMIPTLGNGSRPSATRVFRRKASWILSQSPLFRQRWNCEETVPQGGKSWQHPPGTARPQHIEDGVDEGTLLDGAGPPCFAQFPLRQQRPNELPLFVRKIAGVSLRLAHARIIPVWSIANSLLRRTLNAK